MGELDGLKPSIMELKMEPDLDQVDFGSKAYPRSRVLRFKAKVRDPDRPKLMVIKGSRKKKLWHGH